MSEVRESVKVLLEAAEVQRKKAMDYQNPNSTVVQADYYPNGVRTIQDIIWAKNLRARSLLEAGAEPKHESLEDTYLDMINYCSFAVAYLRGKVPGQDPGRDAFNRPRSKVEHVGDTSSIPQYENDPPWPLWQSPTLPALGPHWTGAAPVGHSNSITFSWNGTVGASQE